MGGVTAYANEAKAEVLAVPEAAFALGAVSEAVALAMARGARHLFHADIGVADTGIAGPGGATPTKPVGLFYIALSSRDGYETVQTHHFDGDREQVRRAAADAALSLLAEYVDAQPIRDGCPRFSMPTVYTDREASSGVGGACRYIPGKRSKA